MAFPWKSWHHMVWTGALFIILWFACVIAHGNKILNAASPNQHAFELLKKFIPVLEIFYKLCSRDFYLNQCHSIKLLWFLIIRGRMFHVREKKPQTVLYSYISCSHRNESGLYGIMSRMESRSWLVNNSANSMHIHIFVFRVFCVNSFHVMALMVTNYLKVS